jgi:hypothetical protein
MNQIIIHSCWTCGKEHDFTKRSITEHDVKCDCGGYVVTPSGKVQSKIIPIVQVFQLNEYDAVAALTPGQAQEYYMKLTGLDEEEAVPDEITVVPMDYMVWEDETMKSKMSVKTLIENEWKGEPFIAFSSEW